MSSQQFDTPSDAQYVEFDTTQLNNIWQIGPTHKILLNGQYMSPPNVMITDTSATYPIGNRSSFILKVIVNNTYGNFLETGFDYKLDSDTLMDGGMIEISRDSGATWTNIINDPMYNVGWGGTGVYSASDYVAALGGPGFSGRTNVGNASFFISDFGPIQDYSFWFRFTFASDSTDNMREGWLIDDIYFYGFLEGVNEYTSASSWEIFPNPSAGLVQFNGKFPAGEIPVSVYDVNGKLVAEQKIKNSETNLSFLPDGIYEVIVNSGDKPSTQRVIIHH
jgi:hypothetical protein